MKRASCVLSMMAGQGVFGVVVSECGCYVIGAEEGCAIFCRDGADVGVLVGKDGDDLVYCCSPS